MNGFKDDEPVTLEACARFAIGRMVAAVEKAVIVQVSKGQVADHGTTSSNEK